MLWGLCDSPIYSQPFPGLNNPSRVPTPLLQPSCPRPFRVLAKSDPPQGLCVFHPLGLEHMTPDHLCGCSSFPFILSHVR